MFYRAQAPTPVLIGAVVLAALLAGVPAAVDARRRSVARAELEQAGSAILLHRLHTGRWPGEGRDASGPEWSDPDFGLWVDPGLKGWRGPYLRQAVGLDPWGRHYHLDGEPDGATPGARSLASAGPDGVFESWNRGDLRARGDDIVVWLTPPEGDP